jgi:hypothetical protein
VDSSKRRKDGKTKRNKHLPPLTKQEFQAALRKVSRKLPAKKPGK